MNYKTVIELGLEPRTYSLEDCCSIQLSYSTIICGQRYEKNSISLHTPARILYQIEE